MSNEQKDSAATCQHANLMPVTSQGSVYVSRCTSCNEVRVDSDWQKDSATEQRCPECQWLISAVGHSPSCSHAFSEVAASEPVYRTVEQLDGSVATFADIADSAASEGVPDDNLSVFEIMQRFRIDGSCERVIKEALEFAHANHPAVRASVDEAAIRRAAEKIAQHLDPYDLGFDLLDIAEIITTELQKGK